MKEERARLALGTSHEWEEAAKALAAKRTIWDHMSSIIITGKSNQFPILEVCKRRSKRITSLEEKRQARDQESLPLHPPPPSDRAESSSIKVTAKTKTTTRRKRATKSTKRQVRNKREYGANSEGAAKVQACRRSTRVSLKPERFGLG